MNIQQTAIAVLEEARYYLEAVSSAQYTAPVVLFSGGTIGQHTRHFIEFFQCLLQQYPTGIIDYSRRQRNLHIESDPAYAWECITDIQHQLQSIPKGKQAQQLCCAEYVPNGEQTQVATSLYREVLYNIEHTIHHYAIIKIGLKEVMPALLLPPTFGVAPSTVSYRTTYWMGRD